MILPFKHRPHHHPASKICVFILSLTISQHFALLVGFAQEQRPRRVGDTEPQTPQEKKPQEKAPAKPQEKTPAKEPTPPDEADAIRIKSNLVAVPVSVTDSAGQPVTNLVAKDFRLEEEGEQQTVTLLGQPGKTPIDLALLFDVSGSVLDKFEFEQQAAARFLKKVVNPVDHVTLFSIALKPKLASPRTAQVTEAIAGIESLVPSKEATAFFDTVGDAAKFLGENATQGARRVLIVISDGEDNYSDRYRLEETLRELQRNDCIFYSINPSGPSIWLNKISIKGQDAMIALAAETGGVAFLPAKLEDLDRIFVQIAAELQTQYLLGYYPINETTDGKFRRITARVPGRPDLRVRSRQGYYAPKD